MRFKFQTFFDIQTSAESMQIIQWSVGGSDVLDRCRHLFGAYKYFKLGKISVKMVPASTLPVDPLGLSYGDTDPQTVDPRDQMNPGLVRITNGEDIPTSVSEIDPNYEMDVYNAMMLDPRWSKFMLQSGFRRSAYPLYWQVGQLSQDKYPGSIVNVPSDSNKVARVSEFVNSSAQAQFIRDQGVSSARGLFQVGHRGKLGYLPTDFYQYVQVDGSSRFIPRYGANNIPEVKVITCVLPKAYKTIYYYRVFVTEEVYFTGLRSAPIVTGENNNLQINGLDQFIMGGFLPTGPGGAQTSPASNASYIPNNGQNRE